MIRSVEEMTAKCCRYNVWHEAKNKKSKSHRKMS